MWKNMENKKDGNHNSLPLLSNLEEFVNYFELFPPKMCICVPIF